MSSSDGAPMIMHAQPWDLDELPMPDRFAMAPLSARQKDSADDAAQESDSQIAANAYARGFADAQHAAHAAADARVSSALAALTGAIDAVNVHSAPWIANIQENVAALAVAVARHIVEREVSVDHTIVRDLVQRALTHFPIDQTITIRVHAEDAVTCSSAAMTDAAGRLQDIRWIADPHIARGGCLVEGRERIIDGRVDTSLERAYRSIGQVQA